MLRTKSDAARFTTNSVARLAYRLFDEPLARFGEGMSVGVGRTECIPQRNPHAKSGRASAGVQRVHDGRGPKDAIESAQTGRGCEAGSGERTNGRQWTGGGHGHQRLLTKVIFDQNPTNEFYVEESFPLDWMYDHLEPYGIIMKIDRQPLPEIGDDIVKRDHEFWSRYSDRLVGNWITYDTPVKEICDFVTRVYEHHDYTGFKGDRKFVRDDQAQKSFSKLRSSIGGVYSWRLSRARTPADQQRMLKEADFAFRQAFAFCPYSPEAVFRYTTLLASYGGSTTPR